MCGITGFWQPSGFSEDTARTIVEKMADCIAHRGPDDAGVWIDESADIALAHRRLSILDLSPSGHQPMISSSGRYVLIINGEIYNHLDIRQQLNKSWRGHSDTETLLAGFEAWGIEKMLKKTVGMFAIAFWDCKEKTLTLARDRIGEKPLYYGIQKNTFIFGSELKALRAHPDFIGEIDRDVLCLYLRHCYVPAPYSIYKGIYKLLPGNYIQFPILRGLNALRSITPKAFWSLPEIVSKNTAQPFTGNDTDAIAALDKQLRLAIGLQMIADVPLGAFLSGGVDSSTIVALMQAQSSRPIKTFSIGFNEASYNEAGHAKTVAQHLGTDHTELYISPVEARQVITKLGSMYDEPFADSSQIPTFLVSELARKYVKVSLSGDGGDELFGGYNRHTWVPQIWNRFGRWPRSLRNSLSAAIGHLSPKFWDTFFRKISFLFPGQFNYRTPGHKMHKLAEILPASSPAEMYRILTSHWKDPSALVLKGEEPLAMRNNLEKKALTNDFVRYMMLTDLITYLPDDILTKIDRASMGVGLEARVPFLDHRVAEFAWRLPLCMKIRNGRGKWVLRQVLYKYVPEKLVERPKSGFGIPINSWLRGPLRDWAEALLNETRLRREGFFNLQLIRQKWEEHLSGKRNWAYHLWDVLMFQSWLETERENY